MDVSVSTSASTIRSLHIPCPDSFQPMSSPSSPRSSALPSPPDSPSSESVSSLPSVTSSFFFSSGAASAPDQSEDEDHELGLNQGLIIPSLLLPPALRQPTEYGKVTGDIRLIVVAGNGAGDSFTTKLLLEDNEDIVDFEPWQQLEYGRMLRASTDWEAQHDPHGLEKYEPARNVEILEVPGYDQSDNVIAFAERVKDVIHAPFHSSSDMILPSTSTSVHSVPNAASLVSPAMPLYTALIMVTPSTATRFEETLIQHLSPHIPIILFSRPSNRHNNRHIHHLTAFRPTSIAALRTGLFRSPDTLGSLRTEAADRFLRWREIENTARQLQMIRRHRRRSTLPFPDGTGPWSKSEWEAEWEARLSEDASRRMQDEITPSDEDEADNNSGGSFGLPFDPLHFPSLLLFSMSLFSPLRDSLRRSAFELLSSLNTWNVRLAILSGFCIGLGAGMLHGRQ